MIILYGSVCPAFDRFKGHLTYIMILNSMMLKAETPKKRPNRLPHTQLDKKIHTATERSINSMRHCFNLMAAHTVNL